MKTEICVIGGGPAGFAAAMRALDFGKAVVLVEKDKLGGAGVYDGALTSKTLWELSRETQVARQRAEKYFQKKDVLAFDEVMNEVKEAIYERKAMIEHHLYHLTSDPMYKLKVIHGSASFENDKCIAVTNKAGETIRIEADYFVLATGSKPRYLPHLPIDENIVMTSDGLKHLKEFPKSMVVLGAGVIGCEFTTIFSSFGETEVKLICREDRILSMEDPDISEAVETSLLRNGVIIHKNAELRAMEIKDGKVHYQLCISQDLCHWFEADKALISVGRIANTEGLGLEKIGVKLKPNGYLSDVDSQTSIPHIYAVGDLTADISLVNVAEQEGRHAIEQIVGLKPRPLRYDNISTIMFLNPEIAGVGMNEQQAQAANMPYKMAVLDYRNIARAIAMRNTIGFFKILVTDEDIPKILGMRAIGEHASSAIQAVALMIGTETTIDQLADMIHPHPSIVEGIQEALRMLLGRPIFKDWYPNPYSKVVQWSPKPVEILAT